MTLVKDHVHLQDAFDGLEALSQKIDKKAGASELQAAVASLASALSHKAEVSELQAQVDLSAAKTDQLKEAILALAAALDAAAGNYVALMNTKL